MSISLLGRVELRSQGFEALLNPLGWVSVVRFIIGCCMQVLLGCTPMGCIGLQARVTLSMESKPSEIYPGVQAILGSGDQDAAQIFLRNDPLAPVYAAVCLPIEFVFDSLCFPLDYYGVLVDRKRIRSLPTK